MSGFDNKSFKNLFKNLHELLEYIERVRGGESVEDVLECVDEPELTDYKKCMELSIVSQISEDTLLESNLDMLFYNEIKEKNKTVGARGILEKYADGHGGTHNPVYFYEFAHLPSGEEYIKEVHLDAITMVVLAPFDKDTTEKGSLEARALVERVIGNSPDLAQEDDFRYGCLVESENFEIWKIGLHQEAYQLDIVAQNHISGLDPEFLFEHYLSDRSAEEFGPFEPLTDDQLGQMAIRTKRGQHWYHVGAIDLDPELTVRKTLDAMAGKEQVLADEMYFLAVASKFDEVDLSLLPKVVPYYDATKIATLLCTTLGREGTANNYRDQLKEACRQSCPDKLDKALALMRDYLQR